MANVRQRSLAYLTIAMAVGQAFLAIGLSWVASTSSPKTAYDFHSKVELPLWFAVLPAVTAVGLGVHLKLSRHVDRACPWASLTWIILAANIVALTLFMQLIG